MSTFCWLDFNQRTRINFDNVSKNVTVALGSLSKLGLMRYFTQSGSHKLSCITNGHCYEIQMHALKWNLNLQSSARATSRATKKWKNKKKNWNENRNRENRYINNIICVYLRASNAHIAAGNTYRCRAYQNLSLSNLYGWNVANTGYTYIPVDY